MTKKYQQLLLTSLIIAMILPFSSMQYSNAETSSYEKAKPILDKIERLTNTISLPVNDASYSSGSSAAKSIEGENVVNATKLQELRAKLVTLSVEQRALDSITPQKRADLRAAQEKISNSIIPWIGLGVNEDKEILEIELDEKNSLPAFVINMLVKQYTAEPFKLIYTKPMVLTSCMYQDIDCDTIIGGLKMYSKKGKDCTIGLPVIMNDGRARISGYITAAHCVNLNDKVYQPSTVYAEDGKVIKVRKSCDCAFIENTGTSTIESATWQRIGVNTITSKIDPLKYDWVAMIGQKSGTIYGQVVATDLEKRMDGVKVEGVLGIKYMTPKKGDSGAPIVSMNYGGTFHGTVSGYDSISHDTYAVKWSVIDRALNLR